MTRNTILYLQDMLDNMRLAEEFIRGVTPEEFNADRKTAYAVFRCLEVIEEAAKNVPASVREQYSAIPWKDMAGMRDRVIHFYLGVSYELKCVRPWRVLAHQDAMGLPAQGGRERRQCAVSIARIATTIKLARTLQRMTNGRKNSSWYKNNGLDKTLDIPWRNPR